MKVSQINLSIDEIPKNWYNIIPDLPEPLPPPKDYNDGMSRMEFLNKVLIKECLSQEFSEQRWINIPNELMEIYIHIGRPRPLYRAYRLENKLRLKKVKIFYKREDLSPTGSHKINTALAQAYFAMKQGIEELVTETGAGQWGSALSFAANLFNLKSTVF